MQPLESIPAAVIVTFVLALARCPRADDPSIIDAHLHLMVTKFPRPPLPRHLHKTPQTARA